MTDTAAVRREFTEADLTGALFRRVHLNRARFRMVDLTGAVMRDVSLQTAAVDGEITGLVVNGVEVAPLVEAELVRRVPARALLDASDPGDCGVDVAAAELGGNLRASRPDAARHGRSIGGQVEATVELDVHVRAERLPDHAPSGRYITSYWSSCTFSRFAPGTARGWLSSKY